MIPRGRVVPAVPVDVVRWVLDETGGDVVTRGPECVRVPERVIPSRDPRAPPVRRVFDSDVVDAERSEQASRVRYGGADRDGTEKRRAWTEREQRLGVAPGTNWLVALISSRNSARGVSHQRGVEGRPIRRHVT